MSLRRVVAGLFALVGLPAQAVDFSFSGFGTLGYAISNQPYTYQRFIDDRGTLKRDSVAGAQVDARFDAQWSATLQVKAAPSTRSDGPYKGTVSWAFVSYRPTNDWLFRVGKQRIPFYLNSENYDVGVTYDVARLPTEMYSLATSNDAVGASLSKTWKVGEGELALDAIWGKATNETRFFIRDDNPPVQARGTSFFNLEFTGEGAVLTYKTADQVVRLAAVRAVLRGSGGDRLIAFYPFVPITPTLGYYQTSAALPGPGIRTVDSLPSTTVTAGVDLSLPARLRIVSEFARTLEPGSEVAPEGNRGYLSVLKSVGPFTPYVTYAFLRSTARSRNFYNALSNNAVPAVVPGAAQINAAQRAGADTVLAYDQHSWALGTSYSFSATSKLKAEVMSTRVGDVSAFVDAPQGGSSRGQKINVFSLSYSVVFLMGARLRPIRRRAFLVALAAAAPAARANAGVVVIGNPNLSTLDLATLEKVYTGRVIEVNGVTVTAVNASVGSPVRSRFLRAFLNQDEEKYTAYWVVRRYIGKGAPPRELSDGPAVVNFVKSTPGAIGYVDENDVQPGVVVLLK